MIRDKKRIKGGAMDLTKEQKIRLYTNLVRVRKLDETMVKALLTGKISTFFHSGEGQEAVGVGACSFLREDDYLFPSHRGHAISKTLIKGLPARIILAEHYGRITGCCDGVSGFHTCDMKLGIPGMSGTLGGHFPLAVGMGLAAQLRGKKQVVMVIEGEGTYARGTFHESMIMAATWKLPNLFIVENNQIMGNTPVKIIHPKDDFADLGFNYGVPAKVVDGQDVFAVHKEVQTAIDRARADEGPSLIECKTYRIQPHAVGLPDTLLGRPRTQEEIEVWRKRDPIKLAQKRLLKEGVLTQVDIEKIDGGAANEMEEADRLAWADPMPTDPKEILKKALYAE